LYTVPPVRFRLPPAIRSSRIPFELLSSCPTLKFDSVTFPPAASRPSASGMPPTSWMTNPLNVSATPSGPNGAWSAVNVYDPAASAVPV